MDETLVFAPVTGHWSKEIGTVTSITFRTRMHSSRMRTGRTLTVFRCLETPSSEKLETPLKNWRTPPVNRMTDACENITLAKTSFRLVMIVKEWISIQFNTYESNQPMTSGNTCQNCQGITFDPPITLKAEPCDWPAVRQIAIWLIFMSILYKAL